MKAFTDAAAMKEMAMAGDNGEHLMALHEKIDKHTKETGLHPDLVSTFLLSIALTCLAVDEESAKELVVSVFIHPAIKATLGDVLKEMEEQFEKDYGFNDLPGGAQH